MRVWEYFDDRFELVTAKASNPATLLRVRMAMAKLSTDDLLALAEGIEAGVVTPEDLTQLVLELTA